MAGASGSAPEAIEALLQTRGVRYRGLQALRNAGPAAASFVPALSAQFDAASTARKKVSYLTLAEDADALASTGRGSPQLVDELIERLATSSAMIQSISAYTFEPMAADVAGRAQSFQS